MNAVSLKRAQKSLRLSHSPRHPAVFLATCAWIGPLPVVGRSTHLGSFGMSLLTPFLLWPVLTQFGITAALLVLVVVNFLGTWALQWVEKDGIPEDHDARAVVVDEFLGAGLASLMLPYLWAHFHLSSLPEMASAALIVGLVFRIFDITKLPPANWVDISWHHPYSVIADDLIAGLQTMLVLGAFCLII